MKKTKQKHFPAYTVIIRFTKRNMPVRCSFIIVMHKMNICLQCYKQTGTQIVNIHVFVSSISVSMSMASGVEGSSSSTTHRHTNRLAKEKSPYLLQHAHNPVDWYVRLNCFKHNISRCYLFCTNLCNLCFRYPWGQDAFDKAKNEDKPIFLSGNGTMSQ